MKAAIFDGQKIQISKDVPDPEIREYQVLIRVDSVGICGTILQS